MSMPFSRLSVRHMGKFAEANFPLAPITIFYGPNEAGKTTLFDACLLALSNLTRKNPILQRYQSQADANLWRADGSPFTAYLDQYLVRNVLAVRAGSLNIDFDDKRDWYKAVKVRLMTGGLDPLALAQLCQKQLGARKRRREDHLVPSTAEAKRQGLETELAHWEKQWSQWESEQQRWQVQSQHLNMLRESLQAMERARARDEQSMRRQQLETWLAEAETLEKLNQSLEQHHYLDQLNPQFLTTLLSERQLAKQKERDTAIALHHVRSQAAEAKAKLEALPPASPFLTWGDKLGFVFGLLPCLVGLAASQLDTMARYALCITGLLLMLGGLKWRWLPRWRQQQGELAKRQALAAWCQQAQQNLQAGEATQQQALDQTRLLDDQAQALAQQWGIPDLERLPQLLRERQQLRDSSQTLASKLRPLCEHRSLATQRSLWFEEWRRLSQQSEATSDANQDQASTPLSYTWDRHTWEKQQRRWEEDSASLHQQALTLQEKRGHLLAHKQRLSQARHESDQAWALATRQAREQETDEQAWALTMDIFGSMATQTDERFTELTQRMRQLLPWLAERPLATITQLKEDSMAVTDRQGQMISLPQLSTGTRDLFLLAARIVLAELALPTPNLLLLDEPFSALDNERTAMALAMLERQASKGWQIVLFTKDLELTKQLAPEQALVHHL